MNAIKELEQTVQARTALPPHGERRRIRKAAKLTLDDIARACRVSRQAVWQWERHSDPRLEVLPTYVRVLGICREAVERQVP